MSQGTVNTEMVNIKHIYTDTFIAVKNQVPVSKNEEEILKKYLQNVMTTPLNLLYFTDRCHTGKEK